MVGVGKGVDGAAGVRVGVGGSGREVAVAAGLSPEMMGRPLVGDGFTVMVGCAVGRAAVATGSPPVPPPRMACAASIHGEPLPGNRTWYHSPVGLTARTVNCAPARSVATTA